ncbi:hypothetical protein Psch_03437 [Pelotomaculum schinkii]|uniref:Uncharacterized protein n=1 Tax=Pelotomaculum schinkii TaxID=78350 RepID=A0A4Y7R6W4_9FIRM|nr:hypothetical protein [Pelotomaculum schinkii]TEB04675.1 hypothetical protein Psch_03437 [Pelotomaculum schinkii]
MHYYLAINPQTGNWCISKTKDIAWSTGENVVLDTGTILADKAIEIAKKYSNENNVMVLWA